MQATPDTELQALLRNFLTPKEIATKLNWELPRVLSRVQSQTLACVHSRPLVLIHSGELKRLRRELPNQRTHPSAASLAACDRLAAVLQNYLSVPEAARELNLADSGIRSKIKFETIESVRIGTHIMIPRSEVSRIRFLRWPNPPTKE